jgi:hypothetical protein
MSGRDALTTAEALSAFARRGIEEKFDIASSDISKQDGSSSDYNLHVKRQVVRQAFHGEADGFYEQVWKKSTKTPVGMVEVDGSQPSGEPGTTVFDSIDVKFLVFVAARQLAYPPDLAWSCSMEFGDDVVGDATVLQHMETSLKRFNYNCKVEISPVVTFLNRYYPSLPDPSSFVNVRRALSKLPVVSKNHPDHGWSIIRARCSGYLRHDPNTAFWSNYLKCMLRITEMDTEFSPAAKEYATPWYTSPSVYPNVDPTGTNFLEHVARNLGTSTEDLCLLSDQLDGITTKEQFAVWVEKAPFGPTLLPDVVNHVDLDQIKEKVKERNEKAKKKRVRKKNKKGAPGTQGPASGGEPKGGVPAPPPKPNNLGVPPVPGAKPTVDAVPKQPPPKKGESSQAPTGVKPAATKPPPVPPKPPRRDGQWLGAIGRGRGGRFMAGDPTKGRPGKAALKHLTFTQPAKFAGEKALEAI